MAERLILEVLTTHLGMDDHPTWALCTGEVFTMPTPAPHQAVKFCPDCYKIAFMKINTEETHNG